MCSRIKIIRVGQQSKEKEREVTDRPLGLFNQSVVKQPAVLMRLRFHVFALTDAPP